MNLVKAPNGTYINPGAVLAVCVNSFGTVSCLIYGTWISLARIEDETYPSEKKKQQLLTEVVATLFPQTDSYRSTR